MALVAGAEKGVTLQDNLAAFSELRFAPPRIANLPAARDLATSVLGQEIALPVIASPTGVQAVHPEGEAGVARGTAEAGTAMGLSSFGSMPVETVAQANPKLFFQTYWSGTRDQLVQRMERARQAGAKGLIVTLDWSFSNGRDWGSPAIPEKMDLRAMVRFAPEGIVRPAYVRDWLRHGGLPDLTVPNMAARASHAHVSACTASGCNPTADLGRHRPATRAVGGPPVKGVMRPDDARRAVTSGPPRSRCRTTAATTHPGRSGPAGRGRRRGGETRCRLPRDPARQRRVGALSRRARGWSRWPRLPVGPRTLGLRRERLRRAPRGIDRRCSRSPVLHR
jgi:L-lactate dehydrogenase (cytochrome)